ncbi:MAG: ECF-type sigma factor [Planctomycetota bacterium]
MPPAPELRASADAWLPALYECLHDLAARALRRQGGALTLQPTALVHEAYLRLVDAAVEVRGEAHFLALAAGVVRQVLVDHARRCRSQKRGGGWGRVTLHPGDLWHDGHAARAIDLLALDEALRRLEGIQPRAARAVELLFFSGLSIDDTAAALGVSSTTVDVDWRFAKAWLGRELEGSNPDA